MKKVVLLVIVFILCLTTRPIWAADPCDGDVCGEEPVGESAGRIKNISYLELKTKMDESPQPLIFDVRSKGSYDHGHIPGTLSFPSEEMNAATAAEKLKKGEPVIVYCSSATCPISRNAAVKLMGFGYDVMNYQGGVAEWIKQGGSLEQIESKSK